MFRIRSTGCETGAWKEEDLLEILPTWMRSRCSNSRCMDHSSTGRRREFAEKHDIAGTVGSDAHAAFELGRSLLLLEQFEVRMRCGRSSEGAFRIHGWSSPWVHLTSRYAVIRTRCYPSLDMDFQA